MAGIHQGMVFELKYDSGYETQIIYQGKVGKGVSIHFFH